MVGGGCETTHLSVGETTRLSGRNDPRIRRRNDSVAKRHRARANGKVGETTRLPAGLFSSLDASTLLASGPAHTSVNAFSF